MRTLLIPLVLLALTSCAQNEEEQRWMTFRATAYSVKGETKSGGETREGHTVAADHAVLPAGTRIEVQDAGPYSGEYVVEDSGPKVRGRAIDIFINNPAKARDFGKKQVRVRVLKTP